MTPEGKLAVGRDLTVPCQHIYHLSRGCKGYFICMMEDKQWANFDGEEQETRRRARMEYDELFKVSVFLKSDADLWDELWEQCHRTSVIRDLGSRTILVITGSAGVFGTSTFHKDGENEEQEICTFLPSYLINHISYFAFCRIPCQSVGLVLLPLSLFYTLISISFISKRTE